MFIAFDTFSEEKIDLAISSQKHVYDSDVDSWVQIENTNQIVTYLNNDN